VKLTYAYVRNVKPNYIRIEIPDAVLPGMYLIVGSLTGASTRAIWSTRPASASAARRRRRRAIGP
jgi:hypothetical protein